MSKLRSLLLATAFIILNVPNAQAKPNCAVISKSQYDQVQKLPGASKATLDRVLGASCQLSGYGRGLTAYGYKLNHDSKNWFVVVFQNGKLYKSRVLPSGMALREG